MILEIFYAKWERASSFPLIAQKKKNTYTMKLCTHGEWYKVVGT